MGSSWQALEKTVVLRSSIPDTSAFSNAEKAMFDVLVKIEAALTKMEERQEEQDKDN